MANRKNTFLIKRSNIAGKVPAAGDLLLGELAINTADAILYASGTTANSIIPIGWDRVARTGDTMTGGLFTPYLSATTISATSVNTVDYIVFNTGTTSAATQAGTIYFDNTEKALSYNTSINQGVTVNLGQQNYLRVINNSGIDIPRGKALEILSAYSGLPAVTLAINKDIGFNIIGVSAEIIPNGKEGIAITNGIISNIELTGMTVGSLIYASDSIAGKLEDATKYLSYPLTARTNSIGYVVQTGITTGKLFVDINNENSVLSLTDLQRNVLEGNVISTGIFEFTGITLASSTTINIANIKGWIVNNTYLNGLTPDVQYVEYSGGTNISLSNINTADSSFILINSASTIVQQTTFPTPQQRRENIYLGKVIHPNRLTIQNVNNTVDFDVSPMSALRDLWTPLKLINQGIIISPNGANLNINTSAGTLWGNGIGWITNQLTPDSVSISGTSPTTFQYRVQTGGTFTNTTTIDVANYDLNGVVTAVGGGANASTNQRVFLFPTGVVRIQYGQVVHSSLTAAVSAIQTELFIENSNNRDNGVLIGILSVNKNSTLLNDTSQAVFTSVSKFGELLGGTGGISTTTLQQAYDNSSNPEIVINSLLDGLSIKNGTGNADNITRLIEGMDATGNITSFIRADGNISGTTFQSNGFIGNSNGVTATTVSATTYLNLPFSGTVRGNGTINYLPKWTGTTALGNSLIRDDGTNIGVNTAPSSAGKVSIYTLNGNTYGLYVQNQNIASSYGVYAFLNSGQGSQTAVFGVAEGHPTTGTSIGLLGNANDGLLGIGVKGSVGTTEFGSMATGIGGYFDGRGNGGYGYPSISYSVQLLDGTEAINKVLVSQTSDGKANWSSVLSGLTGVYTNTISATTYLNLPIDIRTTGVTVSSGSVAFNRNDSMSAYTVSFSGVNINVISDDTNKRITFSASTGGSALPTLNQAQIFIGDTSNTAQARSVSGDISLNFSGVTTIQPNVVTYSKMQTVSTNAILGSQSVSGGTVEEIPFVDAYLISGSATALLLENGNNWDIDGVYTGTTITSTYQGQSYYSNKYWFTAVDDNNWIRLIRG